jgi:hypothetical protein
MPGLGNPALKNMKKNIFAIVMALVMAIVMMVPVFATTTNPFATVNNGNMAIVDTAGTITTDAPVVEDIGEAPAVEDIGEAPAVETPIDDGVHVCPITKANEHRHIVDCDECGNYEYVRHEELEASVTNAFFHSYECVCGYGCSETHNFATTYNATSHQEVCVDCGYAKTAEPHVWENDFWSQYHDIQCSECGFIAEHHVGVSFETIDNTSCQASCRQCGIVESVAHNFYDFECDNCHYEVRGYSYGIVEDIREMDDGYRVRFLVNGNSHRITVENAPDFNEGDFVEIDHYGNTIFGISVMISGDVVDAPEAFPFYIQSDMIKEKAETFFDAILVDSLEFREDKTIIQYETGKIIHIDNNYIVYNLVNGEMFELSENYAYLSFVKNGTRYFIAIW